MPVEEADVAVRPRGAGLERARFADSCGLFFWRVFRKLFFSSPEGQQNETVERGWGMGSVLDRRSSQQ